MERIEVRGAPSYYACEVGILDQLESLLLSNKLFRCLVITGEKSWDAITSYFPTMTDIHIQIDTYNGECTLHEISRISQIIIEQHFDAIIGIGGGKVLDLAKGVGHETTKEVVLIPTLASTCAAWTPLSVIYNEEGQFTHYTIFPKSQLLVLIEPRAILNSPKRFLIAGIADTLAKWYEADVLIQQLEDVPIVVNIAHQMAKLCKEELLEHSNIAIQDLEANTLSASLLKVIETNIVAGGMVGGFGDQYGRIAGAHAVHNGLTAVNETHHLLHGEKVAYGILVQLALEEKWQEIKELVPFYQLLELPYKLEQLHLNGENLEKLQTIARAILLPHESIHLMEMNLTEVKILQAIYTLEDLIHQPF
ncbi:iron-containing alcohol dehydrogenase family protein [Bacillus sp. PS06]|uniref:iron-containing alcohol dehydrogenase family protein n=1 Tax=Bacillus sp. PS06 TaxID=2764176 RepID=UPI00177D9899|nr:iron-containing alcohol dehydrogenase family protein [Bacillus sp. PS06]MBD8067404.1 iron-containing alcohol dehydrogenase family protein [Bacillus sp. PS06]